MKKIIVVFIFIISFFSINAQKISYGLNIGINGYDIDGKDKITSSDGFSFFNFGVYLDLKLTNKLGVKGNITYSREREGVYAIYRTDRFGFPILEKIFSKSKLSNIHFYPLLKFDLDADYGKGFYLVGGPRISFIFSSKFEGVQNINSNDFYKSTNAGIMIGFGTTFSKHFGFELIGDYLITNKINFENQKITNFGGFFNFTINLESILNN